MVCPDLRTPITRRRPGAANKALTLPSFNKSQGHNFTARWQASDSVALKNILSMRVRHQTTRLGSSLTVLAD